MRILWISDKLWQSLNADQKQWVLTAGPRRQHSGAEEGFRSRAHGGDQAPEDGRQDRHRCRQGELQKIADPYLDKLAKELGPHAEKVKTLIRAIN